MFEKGFTDAALDSADAFRAILSALARPGEVQSLAGPVSPPPALSRAMATIALTLCDFQSPIWLSASLNAPEIRKFLRFHASAPFSDEPGQASFAFLRALDPLPPLNVFMQGTHEYPDRSATIVIEVDDLASGQPVTFSGPGLAKPRVVRAAPLDDDFWPAIAENNDQFPLGIDFYFCCGDDLLGCPRSIRIDLGDHT